MSRTASTRRAFRLVLVLAFCLPAVATAQGITVAAASDLTFAFQDLASRFQAKTGSPVKLSFGSSGNFFAQIENGAPYDLFFSADIAYPRRLEDAGLIEPGTLYEYAVGKIVAWVPADSRLEVSRGLRVLLDPSVRKIAIANPEHAPYGRAAVAAMQHDGVYGAVRAKLVLGENISQTAQFVQSGAAEVGILALSLAVAPALEKQGKYFEISSSSYPAIEQAGAILKSSPRKPTARQFLDFLRTPESVAVMRRYGFVIPGAAASGRGHE